MKRASEYFLLDPSHNPRITTLKERLVDSSIETGQFYRHYELSRKFDVIKKMAANTTIARGRWTDSPYPLTMILRKTIGRLAKNVVCHAFDRT